jgi:nucleotide-binding universal stress UspA family protein
MSQMAVNPKFQIEENKMKILIGYDGSDVSRKALEIAQQHAKAFEGSIFLVIAVKETEELDYDDIKKAERILIDAEYICKQNTIPCEKHVLVNELEPGESLVMFSNDNQIDEIILGIHRTSKVGKMLFGSTAQYVILEADCPVITTK